MAGKPAMAADTWSSAITDAHWGAGHPRSAGHCYACHDMTDGILSLQQACELPESVQGQSDACPLMGRRLDIGTSPDTRWSGACLVSLRADVKLIWYFWMFRGIDTGGGWLHIQISRARSQFVHSIYM